MLEIILPTWNLENLDLAVVGDTPLLCNSFAETAKEQIYAKTRGEAPATKTYVPPPDYEFRESLYYNPDGSYSFPAAAFKRAMISACHMMKPDLIMRITAAIHVKEPLHLTGGVPVPRADTVRNPNGPSRNPMKRIRAEFRKWRIALQLEYNADLLTPAQIVQMLNAAGKLVGVGDWRVEKKGYFGQFHVETDEEAALNRARQL